MDRLFSAGEIENTVFGPRSKERTRLARKRPAEGSNLPSDPLPTLPTPLPTHTPNTPSVRAPASEGGRARGNGGGTNEGEIVL
jgi:hypothetical protein